MTTAPDLATARADAVARLGEQRAARVHALLAGDLDAGDDLALIEEAEAELVRRERAAALAEYRARRAALRDAIRAAEENRLAAVAEAEQAARAFVSAIARAEAAGRSLVDHAKALTGRTPLTVSPIEMRNVYSDHLAGLLGTLPETRARWGHIEMPSHRSDPNKSWVTVERERNAAALISILETADRD